jgi:ATP-dependent RNA helicase RhlE
MPNFQELKINKSFLKALEELDITKPSLIQEKAIPRVKAGADVIGIAQTGTGKTFAYLLPILCKLVKAEGQHPRALILVPTRELAIQVDDALKQLLRYSNIRSAAVFGGIGMTKHAALFDEGNDILVATPGRFMDLYLSGVFRTSKIKTIVFDEFDRMLDMGFKHQIFRILEIIPNKRQNLLFSATFPPEVEEATHEFLAFPEKIEVAAQATPAKNISQFYYKIPNFASKANMLIHLMKDEERFNRVIIFVKTKQLAEQLSPIIFKKVEGEHRIIHSNKAQNSRINAINDFKDGKIRCLITTDVSARGIDVLDISHVINFNIPENIEDYVHRIGRTARVEKKGTSISFVADHEMYYLRQIEKLIRRKVHHKIVPTEVEIYPTLKHERIEIEREIDRQKRLKDPNFKGAFHKKKYEIYQDKNKTKIRPTNSGSPRLKRKKR